MSNQFKVVFSMSVLSHQADWILSAECWERAFLSSGVIGFHASILGKGDSRIQDLFYHEKIPSATTNEET